MEHHISTAILGKEHICCIKLSQKAWRIPHQGPKEGGGGLIRADAHSATRVVQNVCDSLRPAG